MCGRFIILPSPDSWADIVEIFGRQVADVIIQSNPRFNVAPTQQIIFIRRLDEGPISDEARWGFVPHWWSKTQMPNHTINARAEEAAGKPMWRNAYRNSRCLIPTSGWYEWSQESWGKQPWFIRDPGGQGMLLAGLWSIRREEEDAEPVLSCAILTMAAAPSVKVHDRMPVALHKDAWQAWVDPELTDADAVTRLWQSHARQEFEVYPVSTSVNSSRNQGAELINKVDLKPKPF